MLPYLPYAALLLSIFYLFYKLLLEKETFFQLNRWYLVGGVLLCFLVPSIEIPEHWSIRTETATFEPSPASTFTERETPRIPDIPEVNTPPEVEAFLPVEVEETYASKIEEKTAVAPAKTTPFWQRADWLRIGWYVYLSGLAIFLINLLIQLAILIRQIIKLPKLRDGKFHIVELDNEQAPFSFLNYIFINPTKYDWDTYQQILQHEKVHISQAHSIDMILAELLIIVQWFNPFAWWYRKSIENNLEYLTDSVMLDQGVERQPYQMNLLKVSVPHYPFGFAMNYNQSFLKKRIKMMNAKKSSASTSWKYLAILPIIGLCLICFNAVKVVANQQKQPDFTIEDEWEESFSELAEAAEAFGEELSRELTEAFEGQEAVLERSFRNVTPLDLKGIWRADIDGSRVCVQFDNSNRDKGWSWVSSECFDRSEFSNLPSSKGEFTLKRAAGTVNFTGEFDGDEGYGRYEFVGNQAFVNTLNQRGIRGNANEETLFHFFLSDIDEAYLEDVEKMGFSRIDMEQLRKMAIHDVSKEYIREMAGLGYDDLSPDDLVKGKIHDVDPDYIKEIRDAGFPGLDFEELVKFSIHDVDAEFVESLAKAGFTDLSAEEIVKASIHDVDAEYLEELSSVGYDLEELEDVIKFSIHGVDAEVVEALKEAGFANLDAEAITKAAIHGVDKDYIEDLEAAGYQFDDIEDVIKFSIHGVDADFIEELNEAGYSNLSAEDIRKASIHGVDQGYIRDLKETGMDLPDIDDLIQFSIHGVRPSYISELKALGYGDLSPDKIQKAAIHGVRTSYIEDLNDLGFENIPIDEVIKCKIHGLSARDIREARENGYKDQSLEEYRKMKIRGTIR